MWLVLVVAGCREPVRLDDRDPGGTDAPSTPETTHSAAPPPTHTGRGLGWSMIDMGYREACGVLSDGRAVCWGHDALAQPPPATFRTVSVNPNDACGIRVDGGVTCWNTWPGGPLSPQADAFVAHTPSRTDLVRVEVTERFACAETRRRTLVCWGRSITGRGVPTGPVAAWDLDLDLGCAVDDAGGVTCWGDTDDFTRDLPEAATAPPPDRRYVDVAVGRNHACALDDAGAVACWGQAFLATPYPPGPPGPFVDLDAYNQITCGLRADRSLACWYDVPQLWDIDDEPPDADGGPPWEPPPGHTWAQVGLGEWDACGVTSDGEGRCWPVEGDTAGEVVGIPDLADL